MIIYVDSNELIRRVELHMAHMVWEPPVVSATLTTSAVSRVEVARVLHRTLEPAIAAQATTRALEAVDTINPDPTVLALAEHLPVRFLKSLDAIHVASALIIQCDAVLTRDRQMARACEELGMRVG